MNERIRASRVRLIDEDGSQLGVFKTDDAMKIADDRGLDLVEVAEKADPPVTRIMDYSKYKYELDIKAKKARKHQTTIQVKEIKFRPKIDDHDYETKKRHVERFLKSGAKVKVTIMFRGREMAHAERGLAILDRLAEDVRELGTRETEPKLEGRNLHMMMAPTGEAVKHHDEEKAASTEPTEAADSVEASEPVEAAEPAEAPEPEEAPEPVEDESDKE